MNENLTFELIFDGENLHEGEIDVKDLAPSLISLSDLLDEVSGKYAPECPKISLRVKPNFEKKCFKINLEVAQSYYAQFVELFSSQEVQAWATVLSLVGVSGVGLLQLLKKAKKRKPQKVIEIEHTETVKLKFDEGDDIVVDKRVLSLFQNPKARKAAERMFKPLKNGGVDKIKISKNQIDFLDTDTSDADSFDYEETNIDELESEGEKILRIISPSFQKGNKWRLNDGLRTSYYEITDQNFNNQVREKRLLFGINDFLLAKVKTFQKIEDGEIHTRHQIFEAKKYNPPETGELKI
jgi:hypothetical protein